MEKYLNEINFFWIGNNISPTEQLAFASCIANQMTPVLWCYNEIDGVTDYVIKKDARVIMSKDELNYYINDLRLQLPNVSDIFRYKLLAKVGGIYSDTDVIFIKNVYEIDIDEYFCSTFEYNYGSCASNCFMKIKKNSLTATYLIDELEKRLDNFINFKTESLNYCEFGPFLVQKCASKIPITVLSYNIINPISWRWTNKIIAFEKLDYKFLIKNALRKILSFKLEKRGYFLTDQTYAIHLCSEMWKRYNIDPHGKMHKSSLFQKLKTKYKAYLP
ncbi:glycosyl transferase-like sugar-binding protein [Pedobacter psychrotolerans]|uniref:Glycosyl transferase-like sugar-binding protein n=1 Tax=Pedobacter psychrotolerans TaxID=1843235 RepID=A0A4R2HNL9_9SPHI|nr:glycosyltransferase [Pedobacter psychrotolerans]TCO30794.1 glycosyl transferase-like sugar-binding protein [Pedobacter psychrotolerans]GGE44383.1 hypothetical protein GCM10011413_08130 [Pedobacter psychrotolerans]